MADDDFIVPPAWLSAPAAPAPATPPVEEPAPDEITLPPGLADSVTNRLPEERQRTPPPKPEVTFFPGAIGAPVLPAPPAPSAPPAAAPAPPAPPTAPPAPPAASRSYPPPNPAQQAPAPPAAPAAPSYAPPAYAPPAYAPPPPPLTQAPPAPVASVPQAAPPAPTFAAQEPRWSIALENGLSVPVTGAVYLGRNPSAAAEHPTAATLTIDDPRKSISKTHALLVVDGATAWLTDLHSTNGCAVLSADGSETVLAPGEAVSVPSGATIELGEYAIRLTHG